MVLNNFLVRVRCNTYNHAPFITDTLDGFCMQKTSFSYICTIFDDASTDGESNLLMNYLQNHFDVDDKSIARKEETEDYVLIFARNKNNKNCFFAVFLLKYNHYSVKKPRLPYSKEWNDTKYAALCEGDDFWTDPLKLQKEYLYLECHPEKELVYTNCNVLFHNEKKMYSDVFTTGYFKPTYSYKDFLLEGKYIAPCSWLFRRKGLDDINMPSFTSDQTLCIAFELLVRNKVGYINDTTCTYRIVHGSASHSDDINRRYNYYKGAFATEKYFMSLYKNLFSQEDKSILYNRRYGTIGIFAVALNDKSMIKEIKEYHPHISLVRQLVLQLSWSPIFRKCVNMILCMLIKKRL